MRITLRDIRKDHDRRRFDCGIKALNDYLTEYARQYNNPPKQQTLILEDIDDPRQVIGFITILQDRLNDQPAVLLARLAVDRRYQNSGNGSLLLVEAMRLAVDYLEAFSNPAGLIIDAKDEHVADFYVAWGAHQLPDSQSKLLFSMNSMKATLEAMELEQEANTD
ncbi:GNAT family N-acetyltransferase [Pseudovibrio brasiliensis]|uniref:GNAT family N-acetyltransferase n=1 Tax=Pseudovibrio brasiliensis TaxID=1898042 RepID=A0ABX8AR10_9HYPH|nr:GNAT family N-acetyltransferase [Pseudovibrio brasiliensis]QUS57028.1 GNAT family N-acetyltransferase [Pseudovibrio brasiliensis]